MTADARADPAARRLVSSLAPRLELLRGLGRWGGVSAAAEAVGIPQPTATRWLADVSAALGTDVTVRQGRSAGLTRAGTLLAEAAEAAMSELAAGARAAVNESDPQRGSVVFGFLHTMGGTRAPELLGGFRHHAPRVRFTLVQSYHEDLLARVRSGEIDLALTSPLPRPSGDPDAELNSAALDEQPVRAVVADSHRLAGRERVRIEKLSGERFVGLKTGYGLRHITDALFAAADLTPELAFEGEDVDTIRGLVAADLGIALLPAAEQGPRAGTAELDLVPPVSRTIGLAWSARRPLPPSAAAFRDYTLAHHA